MSEETNIDDIFLRFFEINKTLKRSEIIDSLCILQKATITWAFDNQEGELKPASFQDYNKNASPDILPVLLPVGDNRKSSLYDLIMLLHSHLYSSVLGGEDLILAYGNSFNEIKIPPKEEFLINPK